MAEEKCFPQFSSSSLGCFHRRLHCEFDIFWFMSYHRVPHFEIERENFLGRSLGKCSQIWALRYEVNKKGATDWGRGGAAESEMKRNSSLKLFQLKLVVITHDTFDIRRNEIRERIRNTIENSLGRHRWYDAKAIGKRDGDREEVLIIISNETQVNSIFMRAQWHFLYWIIKLT